MQAGLRRRSRSQVQVRMIHLMLSRADAEQLRRGYAGEVLVLMCDLLVKTVVGQCWPGKGHAHQQGEVSRRKRRPAQGAHRPSIIERSSGWTRTGGH